MVLSRLDGSIFLFLFVIFLFFAYKGAKNHSSEDLSNFRFRKVFKKINSKFAIGILSIFSLGLVVFGANLMVKSGVALAGVFGISPWIIGITVFAIGTSLPELAASLTAGFRKVPSISVGNIVGSNIFNILEYVSAKGLCPLQGGEMCRS